jgi:hypothetical protein
MTDFIHGSGMGMKRTSGSLTVQTQKTKAQRAFPCRLGAAEFLIKKSSDAYYNASAKLREKVPLARSRFQFNSPEISLETCTDFPRDLPEVPPTLAVILSHPAKQLMALERYERRALSTRKFAIRAFDEACRS